MSQSPLRISLLVVVTLMFSSFAAQAQPVVADPNDPVYAALDAWSTRGILRDLPRFRPYASSMLAGFLKEVRDSGSATEADRQEAWALLEALGRSGFRTKVVVRADLKLSEGARDYSLAWGPEFRLNFLVDDRVGLSGRLDPLAVKNAPDALMPAGARYELDYMRSADATLGGGFSGLQAISSSTSFGGADLAVQAGFARSSWGPLWTNGVVLGPQAPTSGQFSFSWRGRGLSTDMAFLALQQGWPGSGLNVDASGGKVGFSGGKYLMIHGVNWAPLPWMEIGLFETMVYIDRIEPLYFIPLSELFVSQSISGYGDNSFAGLSGTLYLPQDLRFDLVGYADDLDLSGMLKGEWDTKWKVAAEAGLSWAPAESTWLRRLALDYTAVAPYTYTHWVTMGNDGTAAYNGALAYTSGGVNMGPALEPNSDRVSLEARTKVLRGFSLVGNLRMLRHGNASAGIPYYDASTSASGNASGDIGDSGKFKVDPAHPEWSDLSIFQQSGAFVTGTWPKYFRFLTQEVIQTTFQAGFSGSYALALPDWGHVDAGFGYTFEYTMNDGLVAGATALRHYLSLSLGASY